MTKIYSKLEARDKALNFLITTYEDQLNESIEKYNDYMLTLAFKDIYDAAKEYGVNLGNVDLLDEHKIQWIKRKIELETKRLSVLKKLKSVNE